MTKQYVFPPGDVENFLNAAYGNTGEISFRGITAQDVEAEERKEPVEEMARLICEDKELRILI